MNSARDRACTTRSPESSTGSDVSSPVKCILRPSRLSMRTRHSSGTYSGVARSYADRQFTGECGEFGLDVDHEPEHVVEQGSDHATVAAARRTFVRSVERQCGDRFLPDSQHVHVEAPRRRTAGDRPVVVAEHRLAIGGHGGPVPVLLDVQPTAHRVLEQPRPVGDQVVGEHTQIVDGRVTSDERMGELTQCVASLGTGIRDLGEVCRIVADARRVIGERHATSGRR